MKDHDKFRIVKNMLPEILLNELELRDFGMMGWETTKAWILEKARVLATRRAGKQLNSLEPAKPEVPEYDLDALAEMELSDAIYALRSQASSDVVLAPVERHQERRPGEKEMAAKEAREAKASSERGAT